MASVETKHTEVSTPAAAGGSSESKVNYFHREAAREKVAKALVTILQGQSVGRRLVVCLTSWR